VKLVRAVVAALPVAALLVAFLALAGDKHGPEVGATASSFDVVDVTGSYKGKSLCYV
jgi:hypothetical protein